MCGACCRNDWLVTVDEEAYGRNYRLFHQAGNIHEFTEAFVPLGSKAGLGEYAYIAKQADGACWFLEKDNRCRLHRQAGHNHLDSVCRTFPRYPMNTSRGLELTLSFSCPSVLEAASQDKQLSVVRADKLPLAVDEDSCVLQVFPRQKPGSSALRYYFELEQHFIDIMQFQPLPLTERVEMICQTACFLEKTPEGSQICQHLEQVFTRNYALMDNHAESAAVSVRQHSKADALLENFIVNLIFKKTFYLHGLTGAAALLRRVWQEAAAPKSFSQDEEQRYRFTANVVAEIEFKYGHDRRAFWASGTMRGSQ